MDVASALLLTATSLYCGFQATIRVLVYPQFATVPAGGFVAVEREHQRRVTFVVGPLFAFFATAVAIAGVADTDVWSVVAGACFVLILAVTGLAAVPLHGRLRTGFDAATHTRLLAVDTVRVALAVLAVGAAIGYAVAA
ncbi:DUF1772 domain-containing protein [uncultured Jatrophihabitans sp.]|uniref:DUF1772 domain-containing protein n=1 Tax=uncultured Jatrophihabitans sp. TaxID=1610747 RepID=UPI0035CB18C3